MISPSLVARGLYAVGISHATSLHKRDGHDEEELPAGAMFVLFMTLMCFAVILFSINYTYGHIIPVLCMIEAPSTEAYVPVNSIDPNAPPAYSENGEGDDDITLVTKQPYTASIRKTLLHLRTRAGYWSRFRGLSIFLIFGFVTSLILSPVATMYHPLLHGISVVAVQTLFSRWIMTWVHIVISEPSTKRWYQRIPDWSTWRKIAPAVALWSAANQFVAVMPSLVTGSFGSFKHLRNNPDYQAGHKDFAGVMAQGFMLLVLTLALFVLLQIPATVTLVRVAASMLPEEDETIVPFDRSFGGRTTPAIIGGEGKIGLKEAWMTFPVASRSRLIRLIGKVVALVIIVWITLSLVLTLEARLLFGGDLGQVMRKIHAGLNKSHGDNMSHEE